MNISNKTARILTFLSLAMLIGSILVVIGVGIPNLRQVLETEYEKAQTGPLPTVQALGNNTNLTVPDNNALPTSAPFNLAAPNLAASASATPQPGGPTSVSPSGNATPGIANPTPYFSQSCPAFNPVDKAFLQQAQDNTTNAGSMRFDFDLKFRLATTGQTVEISLKGNGFSTGISELNKIMGQFDFQVTYVDNSRTKTGDFSMIYIDQVMYLRGKTSQGQDTGWLGYTLEQMLGTAGNVIQIAPQTGGTPMPLALPNLDSFNFSSLQNVNDLWSILDFGNYICTTRQAGSGKIAIFSTDVDLMGFLTSPSFSTTLANVMAFSNQNVSDPSLQALIQQAPLLAPAMISRPSLHAERQVDTEQQLFKRVVLNFSTMLDLSALSTSPLAPIDMSFDAVINIGSYNEAISITAPSGAVMQDAVSLLPLPGQ